MRHSPHRELFPAKRFATDDLHDIYDTRSQEAVMKLAKGFSTTAGLLIVMVFAPGLDVPSLAQEDIATGMYLQGLCNESKGDFGLGYCYGFAEGTLFAGALIKEVCPPDATNEEKRQVLLKYLNDNPSKLHEPSFSLAVEAFHKAWPCKARSSGQTKKPSPG